MFFSRLRASVLVALATAFLFSGTQALAQLRIRDRAAKIADEGTRRPQSNRPGSGWSVPQTGALKLAPGALQPLQPLQPIIKPPGGGPGKPIMAPKSQPGAGWNRPQGNQFDFGRDVLGPVLQGLGQPGAQPNASQAVPYSYRTRPGSGWSTPPSPGWSDPGGWATPQGHPATNLVPPNTSPGGSAAKSIPQPAWAGPLPAAQLPVPPNPIHLNGRPITDAEIAAAGAVFAQQFRQLGDQLGQQLGGAFVDQQKLIAELNAKSVAADTQIQILEAVRKGDAAQAQIYFATEAKDLGRATSLYHQVTAQQAVKGLTEKAAAGSVDPHDVYDARKAIEALGPAAPQRDAAMAVLEKMEEQTQMYQAVKDAVAGSPHASIQLPGGTVPILLNPKLPVGSAVSLGNGYVIVGTGGTGQLTLVRDTIAHAMGLPMAAGSPVPEFTGEAVGKGVLLVNPADSGGTVQYEIRDHPYQMAAGYTQLLPGADPWVVRFLRGQRQGWEEYSLTPGTYHFQQTDKGWELYSQEFHLTIDNTDNRQPFEYLVNGEAAAVEPGQTKTHSSHYPLVLLFDRGNGTTVKRIRAAEGTLRVAINAADNLWDLFQAGQASEPEGFVPAF